MNEYDPPMEVVAARDHITQLVYQLMQPQLVYDRSASFITSVKVNQKAACLKSLPKNCTAQQKSLLSVVSGKKKKNKKKICSKKFWRSRSSFCFLS